MKKPLFLLLCLLPLLAQAGPVEIDGIYYNLDASACTAEVTNTDGGGYDAPDSYSGEVDIPSSLTYNGIPYAVTSIGEYAFYGSEGLTSLTIPDGVTSIGEGAFASCSGLSSLTIPDGVTTIGYYAFYGCSGLSSIDIPDGVTTIGIYAFAECSDLTSLIIPDGVTTISEYLFNNCSSLESVNIPHGVTTIGYGAFEGCTSLTSITIPDGVTYIEGNAFYNCSSLAEINIPASVTNIDRYVFEKTPWFENLPDGMLYIHSVAYKYKGTAPYGTSITLRDGTVSIAATAFYHCSGVTSVVIPDGVTSIGLMAFDSCTDLTSITIPSSVTFIDGGAFELCTSLTSITLPNGLTTVEMALFAGCSSLTTITLPASVTSVDLLAFSGCSSLKDLYCFAETVPETGSLLFDERVPLQSATLHVPASAVENYAVATHWSGFGNIVPIVASDIVEDKNHIWFSDLKVRALCMDNWDTDGNGSLSYQEAAVVTDLGEVFAANADITSFDELQYFTGLSALGDNTFQGCSNLTSLTLPPAVSSIGANAFANCTALTAFTIPQGVSEIGSYAFQGCTSLANVYCMPLEVPETAANAFDGSNIGDATLHVVVTSYDAYRDALPWKNFKNMLGDIPAPCAAPVISYVDGEIVFTCDMEGVEFNSSITSADMGERKENRIILSVAYNISVFATKEDYRPSETVTATLCWMETEPVDEVATGTVGIAAVPVLVKSRGGVITVEGIGNNAEVKVFTADGMLVGSAVAVDHTATVKTSLRPGTVAVVDLGRKAVKIVVK